MTRVSDRNLNLTGIQATCLIVDTAEYFLSQVTEPGPRAAAAAAASRAIDRFSEPPAAEVKPAPVTEKIRRPKGQKDAR
jgi:hypothetical protein